MGDTSDQEPTRRRRRRRVPAEAAPEDPAESPPPQRPRKEAAAAGVSQDCSGGESAADDAKPPRVRLEKARRGAEEAPRRRVVRKVRRRRTVPAAKSSGGARKQRRRAKPESREDSYSDSYGDSSRSPTPRRDRKKPSSKAKLPPQLFLPEVDAFIQENGINEEAAEKIRTMLKDDQLKIIARPITGDVMSSSKVMIARVREIQRQKEEAEGLKNGAWTAKTPADMWSAWQAQQMGVTPAAIRKYIRDNELDKAAKQQMDALAPHLQAVALKWDVSSSRDPSAKFVSKASKLRSEHEQATAMTQMSSMGMGMMGGGMGGGMMHPGMMGQMGHMGMMYNNMTMGMNPMMMQQMQQRQLTGRGAGENS